MAKKSFKGKITDNETTAIDQIVETAASVQETEKKEWFTTSVKFDRTLHTQAKMYGIKNRMDLYEVMDIALSEYLERNDK